LPRAIKKKIVNMNKTDNKEALDNIIDEFNTKEETIKRELPNYTYTYTGEHYDYIPFSYSSTFSSTQLAVDVTSAISDAVKNGLDNKSIAEVLKALLQEVRNR
jgi:hypothetical protein